MVLSYPFEHIQVSWPELIMQMEGKEPFSWFRGDVPLILLLTLQGRKTS